MFYLTETLITEQKETVLFISKMSTTKLLITISMTITNNVGGLYLKYCGTYKLQFVYTAMLEI